MFSRRGPGSWILTGNLEISANVARSAGNPENHGISPFVVKFQLPRPRRRKRWYSQGNVYDSGVRFAAEVNISTKTWNFIKFHNFQEVQWISWSSYFSQKISILQWRTPQNHQYSLRNINVFASAARAAPVSRKNWKFQRIQELHGNRENFRNFTNSVKNAKSGNRDWAPKRAPDPAPLGAPCYYKTVGGLLAFCYFGAENHYQTKGFSKVGFRSLKQGFHLFTFAYKTNGFLVIFAEMDPKNGGGGISGPPFWAPRPPPPRGPKNHGNRKILKITKNHGIPWITWNFMEFTGISWNSMKFTTFWWNGGLYVPMVENVGIPKGFLVVLEAPWTGICGNH